MTAAEFPATPDRIKRLGQALRGQNAAVREDKHHYSGPLRPGTDAASLVVGADTIVIPVTASIRQRTRDAIPGIEIVCDFDPPPNGMWLWVACEAVAQSNWLIDELRDD